MNLCTNAVQAMVQKGGTLEVSLDEVTAGLDVFDERLNMIQGRYIHLKVGDTGHGMTMQVQEKIFEPYFTTKTKGQGTGMGLSIVQGIVHPDEGLYFCRQ